jgi:hypothetical protein
MLLFIACALFTLHTASAGEIFTSPVLSPTEQRMANAKPGETITVDGIACVVTLVEVKGTGFPRNVIRPMARRAELVATLSDRATRLYVRRFNNARNLSVATSPAVRLLSNQTGKYITTDTEIPGYEVTLTPAFHENGITFTSIVVKRTEIRDGKETSYQWETSNSLPIGNGSSLLASSRLGGKEFALLVTARKESFELTMPSIRIEELPQAVDTQPTSRRTVSVRSGSITIQQPVVASFSVSTMVSSPDSGTVLIGTLRRLSESE